MTAMYGENWSTHLAAAFTYRLLFPGLGLQTFSRAYSKLNSAVRCQPEMHVKDAVDSSTTEPQLVVHARKAN